MTCVFYQLRFSAMKSLFSTYILTIFFFCFAHKAVAQLSDGGQPLSFNTQLKQPVQTVSLPEFNVKQLIAKDNQTQPDRKKALRFAKPFYTDYNLKNAGTWEYLPNGDKVWRISIESKNAFSLNVIFAPFHIPPKAKLFLYSTDRKYVIGAFTSKNNSPENVLATAPISGSEIVIEYFEPADVEYSGELAIEKVSHDYTGIFAQNKGISGDCNVDINCPAGKDWQIEKNAVAKILVDGVSLCTGALLNNTNYDGTPYYLTANHCVNTQDKAARMVFMFNYERPNCGSGLPTILNTISGAYLRATAENHSLDFSLLQLSSLPPESYHPYLAGWNRSNVASIGAVALHHPQGDVKKVSVENDSVKTGDFGDIFINNTHWLVRNWESGVTEPGSSGGPLFDKNHRVVGDLSGGDSFCGNAVNDYYERLDVAWNNSSKIDYQLKHWLDPNNLSTEVLDGFDPYKTYDADIELQRIVTPTGDYCSKDEFIPTFQVKNLGNLVVNSFTISYTIDKQAPVEQTWTGTLQPKQNVIFSFPVIKPTDGKYTLTANVTLSGVTETSIQNNSKSATFNIYTTMPAVAISPITAICSGEMTGRYFTNTNGTYLWTATGNSSIAKSTNDTVTIAWLSNVTRQVNLSVTNGCGTASTSKSIDISPSAVKLVLTTDSNAPETSWELKDVNKTIIDSGIGYQKNTTINKTFCLNSSDCFNFTIYDSGNNGICCNNGTGKYELIDLTSGVTMKYGSSFGSSDSYLFCASTLNYKELKTSDINCYPNPAKSLLTVENNRSEFFDYQIVDICGNVVKTSSLKGSKNDIDLENLKQGIYFLKLISKQGIVLRKFVKME